MAEFWFGCAMGAIATLAGVLIWAIVDRRAPQDFDQYEV